MDWASCRRNMLAKEIAADRNLVIALQKSSERKWRAQETLPMQDEMASSKISLGYDALRELLEALAVMQGYKVYNHECYCAFLKEIVGQSSLGDAFDAIRRLRNAVNYYGKEITAGEAKAVLNDMDMLVQEVRRLLLAAYK